MRGENNLFSNQFGILQLKLNLKFVCFKTSPHRLQLFRRTLWRCFAVKECFVNYKNSPNIPSTWGWVNDDLIFIFGWTYPLMISTSVYIKYFPEHFKFKFQTNWLLSWVKSILLKTRGTYWFLCHLSQVCKLYKCIKTTQKKTQYNCCKGWINNHHSTEKTMK